MKNSLEFERHRDLEDKKIWKLMLQFFWPAFVGVLANTLYNVVDRIFIGRGVGSLALSGISIVFPIMIIVIGFGMLIGVGAGVRVSIALGKKDLKYAEKVVGNAFLLMIVVGLIVTVVAFIIKLPLLKSFGANEVTIGYAQEYLNIILLGNVFQIVGFSMNNVIRSEGNARIAMFSMLISAGINAVLDPVFIFWLNMGVKGAATATVISQFILMIWVLRHFLSSKSFLKLKVSNMRLDKNIIWQIVTIGMSPFTMQIAASFVQATFNTQLIRFGGDVAVGAMGIINSVAILIVMSIISLNMASQPIIGYNFGAKNFTRVRETWNIGMISATIIAIFSFILVEAFPGSIIRLFNNDDPQLINTGIRGLRIFVAMLPLVGFQVICSNYFQSIGKAKISLFLTLLRQVLVLLPLLFILPRLLGIDGVWLAGPVSDFISSCVVFIFYRSESKKLRLLENEQLIIGD